LSCARLYILQLIYLYYYLTNQRKWPPLKKKNATDTHSEYVILIAFPQ